MVLKDLNELAQLTYGDAGEFTDNKSNYYNKIKGIYEFRSCWSIFAVPDETEWTHSTNIRSLVYPGIFHTIPGLGVGGNRFLNLRYQADHVYYAPRSVFVDELDPVRWIDLWIMADYLIRVSGDLHHIFIENFVIVDEKKGMYELITGS